ncbi:hypothetical protein [Bifidobacterium biavatii]|uniref:Uncharacterized protein n=1 Tax=Bifidobacterium biavatii DSM 23969 TaxID=1437608 RepID=A0A086ZYX4_9BIFI|nr:hypothetical protein [Bifidobacterium biavatii]KFI51724.1 hypothetical protein BBIA_0638 [Bifidobacterium biavatii DSM 23969]
MSRKTITLLCLILAIEQACAWLLLAFADIITMHKAIGLSITFSLMAIGIILITKPPTRNGGRHAR